MPWLSRWLIAWSAVWGASNVGYIVDGSGNTLAYSLFTGAHAILVVVNIVMLYRQKHAAQSATGGE